MARDAIDLWCEQQPDVSDRHALRRWLDAMPAVRDAPRPSADDDKVTERPPIAEEPPQMDLDVARSEALQLVEGLADEVGSELGKLAQRNSELEQRVRELEVQFGYEQRLRELELKIAKLIGDLDADHSRTAAPLLALRGGRDAA
jgi:hypothetical protein